MVVLNYYLIFKVYELLNTKYCITYIEFSTLIKLKYIYILSEISKNNPQQFTQLSRGHENLRCI